MSTTYIETWTGTDLSQVGPIYPMVGTEFILWVIGIVFVLAFFVMQSRIEKDEMEADENAAKSPERLKRVFDEEAAE
ncbi:MAG: hypothetical protein OXD29_03045 [Roseovarius sp.]|nr:hypothetical protein [Roseovarius sp.]MCY4206912.1 hypothetical protein [Roseovarius sp.]MCY4291612.1 hypothetical protein [Roseovarius sp.]MCY4316890.1 hypothetical protein [Roseovarius sp.]